MFFNKIQINNLRNHLDTNLSFDKRINIFYGLNGSGKTTILEALSICSFSKSFLSIQDSLLINKNEDFYSIEGELINDLRLFYKIKIHYKINNRKEISSSYGINLEPQDIIGIIPLVTLSPDNKSITTGAPAERRLFIDKVISQSNKNYLYNIIKLKKIIRQRNNLLSQFKQGILADYDLIEPWTELLIDTSFEIIKKRFEFIKEFNPIFIKTYSIISDKKESVLLGYHPNRVKDADLEYIILNGEFKDYYKKIFNSIKTEELKRGISLLGPHKDEIKIMINGTIAKDFASQGQLKTILISIKLAELEYLKNLTGESPIILLDDIFSELDLQRTYKVLESVLDSSCQTFITITDRKYIQEFINSQASCKVFEVINGTVH